MLRNTRRYSLMNVVSSFVVFAAFWLTVSTVSVRSADVPNTLPRIFSGSRLLNADHQKRKHRDRLLLITFINGIYHTEEDWQRISCSLEDIFGHEVRPFYNPTSGWWVTDATNTAFSLALKPTDHAVARDLANHLRKALDDVGPYGRVLHIAHSGGAIVTYLAAKHHLTSWESSRIDVITFGGGRSITHKHFKGRVVNYYAKNDPLVMFDQKASRLYKECQALVAKTMSSKTTPKSMNMFGFRSQSNPQSLPSSTGPEQHLEKQAERTDTAERTRNSTKQNRDETFVEIRDSKHNTSFVFMPGLANNSITDHSMEGPSYLLALRYEAVELQKRMIDIRQYAAEKGSVVRWARKFAANTTGMHHFWTRWGSLSRASYVSVTSSVTSLQHPASEAVRTLRKAAANITGMHGFFSRKEQYWGANSIHRRLEDVNVNTRSISAVRLEIDTFNELQKQQQEQDEGKKEDQQELPQEKDQKLVEEHRNITPELQHSLKGNGVAGTLLLEAGQDKGVASGQGDDIRLESFEGNGFQYTAEHGLNSTGDNVNNGSESSSGMGDFFYFMDGG